MASSSPPEGADRLGRGLVFFDQALLAARDYWRGALARELQLSSLPLDRPARGPADARTGRHAIMLPGDAWNRARRLTEDKPGLIHLLVTAACAAVLHRLTGSTVIVLGSPARGEDVEPNAVPLVVEVAPDRSFRTLLSEVRRVASDAYAHQGYPYTAIMRDFGLAESPERCPLFDVSVTCTGVHGAMPATAEDIAIQLAHNPDRLELQFAYKAALFDATTIDRFAWRICAALSAGVVDPGILVGDIDLLDAVERARLLDQWSRAPEPLGADLLHVAFRHRAAETPEAVAVTCNGHSLTYHELDRRSDALSARLARLGVGPEVVVGLCLDPSIARAVAMLAVLKSGGAFLPLDPEYPAERLQYMVAQTRPRVVITGDGLRDRPGLVTCEVMELDAAGEALASDAASAAPQNVTHPDHLAYIIYTSGSTGRPKGVACHHHGLANLAAAQIRVFDLRRSSRVLQFASFGFDASISEMAMALAAGATLVMAGRDRLFPGDVLHAFLSREQITHVTLVPSVLELLPTLPLASLTTLAAAGEACPAHLVARWAPQRLFLNAYGPTEVTVCATLGACAPGDAHPSIGRPMANMEAYVLDPGLQPVPAGTEGELWIGGVGLARGYLADPAATADRFMPHPFSTMPGARLYRTGDRARFRRDGRLDYLGRADAQVKIRGFRIELGEIEAALRLHPQVADTAVLCREDTPGVKRLIAYVESRPGAHPADGMLRSHLRRTLPEFMLPEAFVVLAALPRTAKDTIARTSLPAPGTERGGDGAPLLPPRDLVELDLVRIWERVLGRDPIGIRDNFFELGGHSFLAVRLLAEIRERFGSDLPLPTVLQKPTIEELAAAMRERGDAAAWSPIVTLRETGARPPLFCVHPAGGTVLCYAELSAALGADQPFHALQAYGLGEEQQPIRSVEGMAALYVDALLALQPQGPYLLAGWSAGGLIAFEMAQQLRERGLEVGLVAMLDAYAPSALDLQQASVQDDVQQMLNLFGTQLAVQESELRRLDRDARLEYVLELAKSADLVPRSYRAPDARRLLDVFDAISAAAGAYRPRRYDGRLTLFAAQENTAAGVINPDDAAHGWQHLARGAVKIHPVHCSHLEMLRPPAVAFIAQRLRAEIDQAG